MDKICNFDIVINTCLAEINPTSLMPDFDKNGFLLSVINGFAYTRRRPSCAKQALWLTSVTRRRPSCAKQAFLLTRETTGVCRRIWAVLSSSSPQMPYGT